MGQAVDQVQVNSSNVPPSPSTMKKMVGQANEAMSVINGHRSKCLIDTGSQVTTLCKSFYACNLKGTPLHSLENLIKVEGANGLPVPYLGYVEVSIHLPGFLPAPPRISCPCVDCPRYPL